MPRLNLPLFQRPNLSNFNVYLPESTSTTATVAKDALLYRRESHMPKQDTQNSISRGKLLADLEQLAKSLTTFTRLGMLMAIFAVLIPFCVSYFLESRKVSWLLAALSIALLITSSIFLLRKLREQA